MKKVIYTLTALLAFVACTTKEQPEDITPAFDDDVITTIIAEVEPATKTTVEIEGSVGNYSWEESETISVFDGTSALSFSVVDRDNGTFQYTGTPAGDLAYAVSPADAITDAAAAGYKLTLKDNYTGYKPNVSNAIMVAGAPVAAGEYKKFTFKHAAALMRFTFENVPAGTDKLVFSTKDKNINGTYTITDIANPVLTQAGASGTTSTTLSLASATTDEYSTLVFYVPIPTGDYTDFTVTLYKGSEVVVTKSMTKAPKLFTAAKGDIINTPVITLNVTMPATYTRINNTADISDGDYLIVCESANVALDGSLDTDHIDTASNTVSISQSNGVIQGSATLDASAFTITSVTGGYTIKSKSGLYIGHSGSNNSLNRTDKDEDAFVNTISFSGNNATITVGSYNLRFNKASGQTRFRYFSSAQTVIQLYKKINASSKPQLSVPQNLSVDADSKTVSWHSVKGAASYTVTIDGTPYSGITETYYESVIADGYYDVSVVAVATDEDTLDSAPATLTGAKFGSPKLGGISFSSTVTVTDNSIEVSWASVAHATKYHCSITPAHAEAQDVTATSVKFEGLTSGNTYEITVYAIDETGMYEDSDPATKSGIKAEEPAGAAPDANGYCFNITSYDSLPTGWTCTSGVSAENSSSTPYIKINKSNSMTSPAYNIAGYSSAQVSVNLATYGSGDNPTATISVSYDGGETWSESTTATPTSSSYITKTFDLTKTLFTKNVVIKIACTTTTGRDLRVRGLSLKVTE